MLIINILPGRDLVMRKATPKVSLYLARHAIERYYRGDELAEEQEEMLNELYRKNPDSRSLKKLRMRLLCRECSDMIVGAVIAEARHEEKIFLRDKYKLRRSFTALSCRLHITVNGLQRWRDKFLEDVAQLMNYELPERDIWSHRKVSVLVRVLDHNIEFLEKYGKEADEESLRRLCGLRDRYLRLQQGMEEYTDSQDDSIKAMVVKARLSHVDMNLAELADLTGYSHTTITMYLAEFLRAYYPEEAPYCPSAR